MDLTTPRVVQSVTAAQLKSAAPFGDPAIISAIAAPSGPVFAKYGLSNRNRILGFLSTALEESGFRTLTENLNYSAERAHQVWPSKFPTVAAAQPYAMQPQKLANCVYGGRMGNVGANDGWVYRGQGLIQITGRDNFAALEKKTGLPLLAHPELVTSPEHMLECSVALFVEYPGILGYCDAGNWTAVWALVGTGRASGTVINPANHQASLAKLSAAIPAFVDVPTPEAAPQPRVTAPPPSAAPASPPLPPAAPTAPEPATWWERLWAGIATLFANRAV
jgi:putative chitinase